MITYTRDFNVFSIENFKFYLKSRTLQRMSRMTKHVSKGGKVDPGDRVTPAVKLACKPANVNPLAWVNRPYVFNNEKQITELFLTLSDKSNLFIKGLRKK